MKLVTKEEIGKLNWGREMLELGVKADFLKGGKNDETGNSIVSS